MSYSIDYIVNSEHVDFQGIVDGLYYPFYREWCRHSFMKNAVGLDLEDEFKKGRIHMLLEYTLRFKKSLKKDDLMTVTCKVEHAEKKNRVRFIQQIIVDETIYAEGDFLATCLINGRPGVPSEVLNQIEAN